MRITQERKIGDSNSYRLVSLGRLAICCDNHYANLPNVPGGSRSHNLYIKSILLYQLSYRHLYSLRSIAQSNTLTVHTTTLYNDLATKKEGQDNPPSCYFHSIFRSAFRRTIRFTVQKLFNITLSKLKLRGFLQVRRFFYRFNHFLINKRIQCCATNFQPIHNLFCTQQPFSTHNAGAPFSIYIGLTKRTILTMTTPNVILNIVRVVNIVPDVNEFSKTQQRSMPCNPTEDKEKSTGKNQCPKFLPFRQTLVDWNPPAKALTKPLVLLFCMTGKHMSRPSCRSSMSVKG